MNHRRSRVRRTVDVLVRSVDAVVPATPTVALHSSPDLDDSIVALLRGAPDDVRLVVLAEDASAARARAKALGLEVTVVGRRTRRGTWTYLRAQVTVSTHGLFGCLPRRGGKHVVGLWHGEFGKLIGPFSSEQTRHFDWVPVSSQLSRSLRVAEFGLHPDLVHVVGSPRQRLLASAPGVPSTGPTVVWAPTYRVSMSGQARTDGDLEAFARSLQPDDPELLALLRRHGATLWYRPHPVADQDVPVTEPWVRRATNADLQREGLTFYELLGRADCLVTDYSSVWVDHLLCDKPMIAFCPDLPDYRSNRGLALEPHERWFPGPVVERRDDLLAALDAALSDPTVGADLRADKVGLLHTARDSDPVAATWEHVAEVLRGSGAEAAR